MDNRVSVEEGKQSIRIEIEPIKPSHWGLLSEEPGNVASLAEFSHIMAKNDNDEEESDELPPLCKIKDIAWDTEDRIYNFDLNGVNREKKI